MEDCNQWTNECQPDTFLWGTSITATPAMEIGAWMVEILIHLSLCSMYHKKFLCSRDLSDHGYPYTDKFKMSTSNEESARVIRYAALASIMPNSPFSKVVFSSILWHLFWRIWKDFVHQCKVLDISSVYSMKIPQDAHIDNVFLCQNPVENCTQIGAPSLAIVVSSCVHYFLSRGLALISPNNVS
jgi:hypothetical protein